MRVPAPRLFASLVPQVLALLLAACGGGDDSGGTPSPAPFDTTAPTIPAGVTAVAQSGTQVLVSWTASTDAGAGVAGYRVYRDGAATPVATVATTSYTDSNLTAGTNYSYTVLAFDAAVPPNQSALSGAVFVNTPVVPIVDTTPPTVPTNLAGTALSPTDVRLTWTASTDAGTGVAGYRLFRNGGATPIANITSGTTYTDTGLTANTAYTYTLRAFDAATPANESALTTGVAVTTLALPDTTAPTVPTGLTATALSSTQIRLNWTASTDAGAGVAGYRVFRNGSTTALTTVTGTTFTDANLTASTAYMYAVAAVDAATPANVSAATAQVTATTLAAPDTTAPTVPIGVTATALSSTQIRIDWSPSTDAGTGVAGYRIFRDGSTTVLATVTSGTTYTDSGLTQNTSHSYTLRAFDAATPANVSGLSTAATATTPALPDTTAPTVPAGVTATAVSTTQIRIDWTASTDAGTGVAGYRIYRDGSATVLATVTIGTTFTDTGLTANTAYSYTVQAFDAATPANVSALSNAAGATTLTVADTTPPTVPGGLTATALSNTSIRLNWTASTDAGVGLAGYYVFNNGSGGGTAIATVTSGTTYTVTGLTPSTAYTFTVRAYDAVVPTPNISAPSTAASATTQATPDTTAPTVPTGVTATALSSTQIRINWTASTDAGTGVAGYRIFRDGSGTVLATVTSGTTYTDSGLTAVTAYSYTVAAFDAATPANVSGLSTAASATTLAVPDTTAPTVPTGVTATAISTTQIRIDWTASTDAGTGVAGYRIYRDGSTTALTTVTLGTTFTDSGLTANTAYSYTVLAFDAATPANVSALSSAASATTLMVADTTPPTTPGGLTATVLSSTSIRLDWTASTDAGAGLAGYYVFNNGSGGGTAIATVTSGTTYTVTGLTPSTAYTYSVRAYDAVVPTPNISAASNAASATTQAAPDTTAPTIPTGVTATTLSASQIRIDWTASTDAGAGVAGYRIFRNGSATVLATVTVGTTYTDTGLAASTMYSYTLRAYDAATPANVSGLSASASATTQASTNPGSGLDTRPSNTSCVAGAPPSQSASFTSQQVFTNLSFNSPIAIMQAPGDNSRWYVVQQGGVVKKFNNVTTPPAPTNFVDITNGHSLVSGGERGLLGMAFHPNFPSDPRVFLYYTTGSSDRLSEFTSSDGGATLDASTENILFNVTDPEDNHNGGNIVFGPDGYLYIGIGDGGGGNDQHGTIGNSQRLTIMLGKMLRIAVGATAGQPYTIPADNPYVGNARCNLTGTSTTTNCPEIYAYGFRNPWRWSFDSGSGELWVGDVGESAWEEVDRVTLGGNYGWRCREGAHSTGMSCGPNPNPIDPIAEVDHVLAAALTGGYVYRGSAIPGLVGRYVFGDYSSGYIWNIARDTTPTRRMVAGDEYQSNANISSFGEDQAHELYFLDLSGGVYKIVPSGGGGGGTIAGLLSQTGCANATDPKLPSSGMIPYAPNAPFWSDGAVKTRWLALPNGANINVDATSNDFDLPNGSVLRKDFALNGVLAETRLFMHHTDGNWAGYTYQWNAMGTDAARVVGGLTTTIGGQTWEFPSESQCLTCHTAAAGRTLGLEIGQLNGDLLYPTTGRTANQVFTLNFIDTLRPVIVLPVDQLPVIPNPFGTAGTADQRARAWLHSNCSNCHRPGGGTPVNLDFRYTTTLLGTGACDVAPTISDLGIANARLIALGDASRSVVVARVNRVGTDAMPPLARHAIDTQGVALLTSWINSLTICN